MVSFGILDELLLDGSVTEIMVNGCPAIFYEKQGNLHLWHRTFYDDAEIYSIIERILSPLGKGVSNAVPFADARLPDGSRVNIVIPPVSLSGPMITIRKFTTAGRSGTFLVEQGTLTRQMLEFLQLCVKMKLNIIVSGGTGSGKTTFLNALASFVPDGERIITIEDTAELQLSHEHLGRLETRPPDAEGKNAITVRQLLFNALRMRPDRIVIGECRAGEALDMLQAMNTGHRGSMTTLHANSPRDCLKRLETMVLMAGYDLPLRAVREQIAAAVHILVQTGRLGDGSRKVMAISEVTGMEGDIITLAPLFTYLPGNTMRSDCSTGGYFKASQTIPLCIEEARSRGIPVDPGLFT